MNPIDTIIDSLDRNTEQLEQMAMDIWRHPELA